MTDGAFMEPGKQIFSRGMDDRRFPGGKHPFLGSCEHGGGNAVLHCGGGSGVRKLCGKCVVHVYICGDHPGTVWRDHLSDPQAGVAFPSGL